MEKVLKKYGKHNDRSARGSKYEFERVVEIISKFWAKFQASDLFSSFRKLSLKANNFGLTAILIPIELISKISMK